ncbi:hypothetical protein DV738_g1729, partial [Chaetothyriales sp. CBS 135597]
MKRKLGADDTPSVEVTREPSASPVNSFESFNLDPRLLQAVAKAQYANPTPVQAQTIPHALEGKDILTQSKTGSGKTAAYVIPTIQSLLRKKAVSSQKAISVLVLVPTRELAEQVHKSFVQFSEFCSKDVRSVNLTQRVSEAVLLAVLSDSPDVVVSTPGRLQQLLAGAKLSLDNVTNLIIDEADLVLSYGYEDDVNTLSSALPRGVQTFLMSATLSEDVNTLKKIFCRDPIVVRIEDQQEKTNGVTQYVVKCAEDEKFLLLFVIFKLRLVRGKCIVFVEDVDRSYRVKLFLEQFGIKSCVLNSELPINTRLHTVQEFNRGIYDILIAADDQEVLGGISRKSKPESDEEGEEGEQDEDEEAEQNGSDADEHESPPKKKARRGQKDYGVSRGIDFANVACVLNFDLPHTSKAYTHRIGRTGRAGSSGISISFVIPRDQYLKHKPTSIPSARHDEKVLAKIIAREAKKGHEVKDYNFDMAQVNSFRYRMNDALRAVTKVAIRETRAKEIKQELIKSEKLRKHFEENPEDLAHLRHDNLSGKVRVQGHLKHVPDYLLPAKGKSKISDVGYVGLNKDGNERRRKRKNTKFLGKKRKSRNDPLKSFKRK